VRAARILIDSMGRRLVLLLVSAFVVASCGGDDVGPADSGTDVGVDVDSEVPDAAVAIPVTPPAPPTLTPCPTGWREVESGALTLCEPWPVEGRAECDDYEMHVPGTSGCALVGTPCPAGPWPEDLPSGRAVLYVDAAAGPGGTGAQSSPFATINEAVAAADTDTIIALAKGVYDEQVILGPQTLWGACPAETHVAASDTVATEATIFTTAQAEVRNLTLGGARHALSATGSFSAVLLEDVVVADCAFGLSFQARARGTLRHVLIRDTITGEGTQGIGLSVYAAANAVVTESVVRNTGVGGVAVSNNAGCFLQDVAIHDTRHREDFNGGIGLSVAVGAMVEAERLVVEDNRENSCAIVASTATFVDSIIRRTHPRAVDGGFGGGIRAPDANLTLRRTLIEDTRIYAMAFDGAATLEDVVLRNSQGALWEASPGGYGLMAAGGTLDATRVWIEHATTDALFISRTEATAQDLTIIDTQSSGRGQYGRAVELQNATLTASRVHVARALEAGFTLYGVGTEAILEDVLVEQTLGRDCRRTHCADWPAGIGLGVYAAAHLDMTRFALVGSHLVNLQLAEDGTADLRDGVIANAPVGVNLATTGFDPDRLSNDVVYRDNGANLDATALPVPQGGRRANF